MELLASRLKFGIFDEIYFLRQKTVACAQKLISQFSQYHVDITMDLMQYKFVWQLI